MAASYTETCDNAMCPVVLTTNIVSENDDEPEQRLRFTVNEHLIATLKCPDGCVHPTPVERMKTFCSPNCLAAWAEEQPKEHELIGPVTKDER